MHGTIAARLDAQAEGLMEVVTTCGSDSERIPCRSWTGVSEFFEELKRVTALRIEARRRGIEWEPVRVSLVYGDFTHQSQEIL